MKTIDPIEENDTNSCTTSTRLTNESPSSSSSSSSTIDHYQYEDSGDKLQIGDGDLLKCNPYLRLSYDVLKKTPERIKEQFYQRILDRKNNVTKDYEHKCLSLPNNLDEDNNIELDRRIIIDTCIPLDTCISLDTNIGSDSRSKLEETTTDNCDTNKNSSINSQLSTTNDAWFKTWPEKRYDKQRNDNSNEASKTKSKMINNDATSINKLSFNDAIQNISLAYSPLTKQLHLIENNAIRKDEESHVVKGHKRNEQGSFSSTISSLSDPSSSGSLLDTEDQQQQLSLPNCDKSKKKVIASFFNKGVFNWKTSSLTSSAGGGVVWRLFGKTSPDVNTQNSPQHEQVVASSSALIQHNRPSNLPAKTLEEELRHRQEYEEILLAAKKKDAQTTAAKQKQQKLQLKLEEQQANAAKYFLQNVLPKWDSMYNLRKTKELWWQGLPSSVRGKVWCLAIGNDLNLTQQLYEICLTRAQSRLNNLEVTSFHSDIDIDQEGSMDVIQLDIARTFPHLGIFQEGGPYSDILHSLLAAYVCYRPDVGYVQGMSYIAAILILNMDQYDAFVCFANLLNRPLHVAAFTLNQKQMKAYYEAYNQIFSKNLPRLYGHFDKANLTPDLYLLDWIYTIYAKAMPLDIACRVWDLFLRDGDEFIFRTALGILHLNQEILLTMDFLHGAQFLTHLPEDLSAEQLFKSIQCVNTNIGKMNFINIVEKCKLNIGEESQLDHT